MRTASRHLAVPIFGPTSIRQAVEETRVPSSPQRLADRRAHAWYIQFMAWWLCYCAFPLSLVVQLSLLPRTPSNVRGCGILMMYRLPARLSLIVVRRMSFVDQYFRCASGCRGVVRCLHTAWAWPARGKSRGRAGDAAGASIGRALPALLGAHVLHVLRGELF